MAFDQKTRNLLQRTVAACRRALDREFTVQLQELYGIQPDGALTPCAMLDHLGDEALDVARLLRERINHLEGGVASEALTRTQARPEHVARVIREQAFTVLNRLAALRLCEERGLVLECVRQGVTSEGFQLFRSSAGNALGETHDAYRVYLHCLFDELALDLGVLFDRFSPLALLFPRHDALTEVLKELNGSGKAAEHEDLSPEHFAEIWQADETIGWIFQYYNDEAERKKMREESAAPRNSRELAVRNQFFTPRYVVEFLTDNTLGRLWYEMTRGETTLQAQCRYLVRQPTEIFLTPGAPIPEQPPQDNLSQEDLLKQAVHITHRPLKDPRTILLLDPACGSMHFGLYAFDLFEVIYDEAWELEGSLGANALNRQTGAQSLHDTYASKDAFLRDMPRLIIEHNLHGIDIDPRCAQIAGLSLWLRAQRAWQRLGLTPADRPAIARSHIVCAEPMPGEKELLRDFVEREFPAAERSVFLRLLEGIFERMQLAGEAGSLLKIEDEIRGAITAAKALWQAEPPREQAKLFAELKTAKQTELTFDLSGITDEEFWDTAETRIYAALRDYAERAEQGVGFQRRLFADDAAQGFAFIDICRKRYDAVVMNPPFGDGSLPSKAYVDDTYGDTKGDVYKAFVECFSARLVPAGYLGIISSRTGFFLSQSEDWRARVVLRLFRPIALADLGGGVLDAMVEVAAYVLRSLSEREARDLTHSLVPMLERVVRDKHDRFSLPKWQDARAGLKRHQAVAELEHLEAARFVQRCSGKIVRYTPLWHAVRRIVAPPEPTFPPLVCVRVVRKEDKGDALANALGDSSSSEKFVCDPADFSKVPGSPFCYWATVRTRRLFEELPPFQSNGRQARRGPSTGDDFRRIRVWWEPSPSCVGRTHGWVPFAKGGKFSPFYADVHLLVAWEDRRSTFGGFLGRPGRMIEKLESVDCFFRAGLTWPLRTNSLSFRLLPSECAFGHKGPAAFCDGDEESTLAVLAISNSVPFGLLVRMQTARVELAQAFEVGLIQDTPVPNIGLDETRVLSQLALFAWRQKRSIDTAESVSHAFVLPATLASPGVTLAERAGAWGARVRETEKAIATNQAEIDDLAFRLYGLDAVDRAALTTPLAAEFTAGASGEPDEDEEDEAVPANTAALTSELLAYALGAAFGRWDIRLATGQKAAPPEPDPFDALPVCPPGTLQDAAGLPAAAGDVTADYPLCISWAGIAVDDPNQPEDIERRLREALTVIFPGCAAAIEHEACDILGVQSLRDYFRKPTGFFADHLKRYSKSRRQAPIYWPFSTTSGSYTLWIYYHRLTPDTLYKCIQQFVNPKLADVEKELAHLRTVLAANEGGAKERKRLEELEALRRELLELRTELEIWAPRWKPNLNDGVLITAAPLWKLFRLTKWQKDLKACWQALESGDYDWAHLAYTLWPDRVRQKCKTDRSLAIAHGLEELCEVKAPDKKAKRAKKATAGLDPVLS